MKKLRTQDDYHIADEHAVTLNEREGIAFKAFEKSHNAIGEETFVFVGEFFAPHPIPASEFWCLVADRD